MSSNRGSSLTMRLTAVLAVAVGLWLGAQTPRAAQRPAGDAHWVATWGTAQQLARQPVATPQGRGQAPPAAAPVQPPPPPAPGAPARRFPVPVEVPRIADQTVRMIVRTSIGGDRVRIRLSNAFGAPAVSIGAAHLALSQAGSTIIAGSDRPLTFGGTPTARLYGGQVLTSDPVDLTLPAQTDLAVSLFIAGEAEMPASHRFGLRPTYISVSGDHTGAAAIDAPAATSESYYWLAGVDVLAPATAGTLVTFGDSITDGDQSTPDTNRMWPAVLVTRLQARPATKRIAVVNAGIAGNRVLGDNNSGLVRFTAHALDVPGVRWVTILEGINDISGATRTGAALPAGTPPFGADDLIRAYRQMIGMAHGRGVQVIGCTITPFEGSSAFTERGEAIREAVNTWIRESGEFDAVVDFDAATRDPSNPRRFRAEADSPDLLHPGDAGYRLMADAFDLSLLTRPATARAGSRGRGR